MIKNGKYFVSPEQNSDNFKDLFARLAAEGAGRSADREGFPEGPWTPELLAQAISAIDANPEGVELRTVQMWFQDNDNGISSDNIRWLARIFGCDDPKATSQWQALLQTSKNRLASRRREKRKDAGESIQQFPYRQASYELLPAATSDSQDNRSETPSHAHAGADTFTPKGRMNLALRSEAMFSGPNSLNLPIAIWGGLGVLWFLAFSLGVHSITYSFSNGIQKQVGLIWSPSWNIGEPVLIPMFLIVVSGLLNDWKRRDRVDLLGFGDADAVGSWPNKINSFWLSYWAIFLICLCVIFIIQWAGVYLLPLLENAPDVAMIDWMLIALVRPEVLSNTTAIVVSFIAFLYSGMIYWFFFTGLLLLYTVAGDFAEICAFRSAAGEDASNSHAFEIGTKIMQGIFRCTVLGILVALSIKLNAAYLVSDAQSMADWIIHDASIVLGLSEHRWSWINGSPSPFFTSFLLVFLLCFVFGACLLLVKSALDRTIQNLREKRYAQQMWFRMTGVVIVLAMGFLLVGQIIGFSIILGLCVTVSLVSLVWPTKPLENQTYGI